MDRRRTADESEADDLTTTCRCGGVALETLGRQILSTIRHCSSCQEAGRALERLPEAPQVLERDGGTAFVLVRKDRVRCVRGGDLVREHRLKQESPTRRLVADRCNSAMFLDFNRGHWISLFGRRLPDGPPPPEMRVMTADRRAEEGLPGDTPNYARHSGRFMWKLLGAWVAMGFRTPKRISGVEPAQGAAIPACHSPGSLICPTTCGSTPSRWTVRSYTTNAWARGLRCS